MPEAEPPDVNIDMVREDLEGLPHFELPEPYSIRAYRPGDEKVWTRIQRAAEKIIEIAPDLHARQFGPDHEQLARRQLFLCDGAGWEVGTGTAWFDDEKTGRVHWVAIVPGHQGKGLSRPLLAAVCGRLKELGHRRAVLTTSSTRGAALRLYSRFGFEPRPGKTR